MKMNNPLLCTDKSYKFPMTYLGSYTKIGENYAFCILLSGTQDSNEIVSVEHLEFPKERYNINSNYHSIMIYLCFI